MEKKHKLIKNIEIEVKLVVILTDVIMTLYVLWLIITNTSTWIPGALFGFTPFGAYELYRAGKLFHLCKTYNLMIVHNLLVYCCCLYQAQIGFGSQLCAMRWIMFMSGFILILFIIFKFYHCHECYNKNNVD